MGRVTLCGYCGACFLTSLLPPFDSKFFFTSSFTGVRPTFIGQKINSHDQYPTVYDKLWFVSLYTWKGNKWPMNLHLLLFLLQLHTIGLILFRFLFRLSFIWLSLMKFLLCVFEKIIISINNLLRELIGLLCLGKCWVLAQAYAA